MTGRRAIVGVAGGIAAYKACELVRRLRSTGADVTVVATTSALRFVGAATFEALSGNQVRTDVFSDVDTVAHVALGRDADVVIVAPATADLLARAAAGRADDLLTATLLVTRAPVVFAPAMHTEMWTHPATRENVATLRRRGAIVVDPAVGRLTGADSGAGRLPEAEHLAALTDLLLDRPDALPPDLIGQRVLISAGGTREPLDPVRFLGNRSSGKQGFALALVAAVRGAQVTLVAANTALPAPPGVTLVSVGDARELHAAMTERVDDADIVVMAAAVADFRPASTRNHKIKKDGTAPAPLELATNPDVLVDLVRLRGERTAPIIVGFAAETGDEHNSVLGHGREKLIRKGCDLLVVNDVSGALGFESDSNAAVVLSRVGTATPVPTGSKTAVAAAVWDCVARFATTIMPPADTPHTRSPRP